MDDAARPTVLSLPFDHLDSASQTGFVYEYLVTHPAASALEIARAAEVQPAVVETLLTMFELDRLTMRVVDRGVTTWEVVQPTEAMRVNFDAIDGGIESARRRVEHLNRTYHDARTGARQNPAVEVLNNRYQVQAHFTRMQQEAVGLIRALDRPPYLGASQPSESAHQAEVQNARMADGLNYRVVYQSAIFDDAGLTALMRENISRGENARQVRNLPVKLLIKDESQALISLEPFGAGTDVSALLVHRSALLIALIEIFETYWRLALPVENGSGGLTIRHLDVLQLLAEGVTDEAISHKLGLSKRTVSRTVAEIMDRLGAETRFQAGLKASARGYFPITGSSS